MNESQAMRAGLVLQIESLTKRFTLHERGAEIDALTGIDVDVSEGRLTALVGASGSGKSTVLRCVYRTYLPCGGTILYRAASGEVIDLAAASEAEILALRRHELRLVSQFLKALPRQPAEGVVAAPLVTLGTPHGDAIERARGMLRAMSLPERLWSVPPATFSGGERQLVNLSRALVVEPRLLLLDEPTASLDPRSADQVAGAIESLKGRGIAILAVFHDRGMVSRLADEVVEVSGGVGAGV